jgi:hypothetical protein
MFIALYELNLQKYNYKILYIYVLKCDKYCVEYIPKVLFLSIYYKYKFKKLTVLSIEVYVYIAKNLGMFSANLHRYGPGI